jgi:periplasmic protein TonB
MDLKPLQFESRKRNGWLFASIALHVGVIVLLTVHPEARFIKPTVLMKGDEGTAAVPIYLTSAQVRSAIDIPTETQEERPVIRLPKKKVKPQPKRQVAEREVDTRNEQAKAGSTHGSMYDGMMSGHDVRPALPLVFPDPPIIRTDLPAGLEGDVVVEVTIDSNGNVISTKLLQGIGHGIEQKVLATVEQWKFKPATEDGLPIPSRQDVHFHYPS